MVGTPVAMLRLLVQLLLVMVPLPLPLGLALSIQLYSRAVASWSPSILQQRMAFQVKTIVLKEMSLQGPLQTVQLNLIVLPDAREMSLKGLLQTLQLKVHYTAKETDLKGP